MEDPFASDAGPYSSSFTPEAIDDGDDGVDGLATAAPGSRILLMGPRRSGKTSVQRVVFQKMSPHETLFLDSTGGLDVQLVANNNFVQFQIWDFPGDFSFDEELVYRGQLLTEEQIFAECGAIVYVLDAQDEPYGEALAQLHTVITKAYEYNPAIAIEVFIHKVDGDLFLSDDLKIECQRDIHQLVTNEMKEAGIDLPISFYLTSIYDHSIFDAFSKVVQHLIPQLPTLENLLNILISNCNIEKAFLFDVISKIYIAMDTNPKDEREYELCSDMIDVVIDLSCIYGSKEDEGLAFDAETASTIHLSSGMVLYMRQVSSYLALVCLIRTDNFARKGLIDYNINCFKRAIADIFTVSKRGR
eukprot:PLAT13762.1.p2 GENE.PLAT13762.1~~PLAT13762.1.p2  ORF type:complete len:371 (+),score=183.05 PLAT13762.1:39-1115(+)